MTWIICFSFIQKAELGKIFKACLKTWFLPLFPEGFASQFMGEKLKVSNMSFPNSSLIVSKQSFPFFYSNSEKLASFFLNHQLISFAFILNFSLSAVSHKSSHSAQAASPLKGDLPLSIFLFHLAFMTISYFSISVSECSFTGPAILLPLVPKYNFPQHVSLLFICPSHFLRGYLTPCVQEHFRQETIDYISGSDLCLGMPGWQKLTM